MLTDTCNITLKALILWLALHCYVASIVVGLNYPTPWFCDILKTKRPAIWIYSITSCGAAKQAEISTHTDTSCYSESIIKYQKTKFCCFRSHKDNFTMFICTVGGHLCWRKRGGKRRNMLKSKMLNTLLLSVLSSSKLTPCLSYRNRQVSWPKWYGFKYVPVPCKESPCSSSTCCYRLFQNIWLLSAEGNKADDSRVKARKPRRRSDLWLRH